MDGEYDENGIPYAPAAPMGPPAASGVSPIPTGAPGDPTFAGFAKWLTTGGSAGGKAQSDVPMSEVPGIIASAPGAVAKALSKPVEKPDMEPSGAMTGGDDSSEAAAERVRKAKLMELMNGGAAPGGAAAAYFQQEGESYAGVGGQDIYNETFVNAPARRQGAMEDLGGLQEQRAAEMARMYDQQAVKDEASAVAMASRAQAEQADIARRTQDLDKATKYYSRELQDSGKFWSNPGNIIAAISYSLMPIFSNDPTVGVKLINQAVQQDMENRQKNADMTTGGMRANLEGYRRIAGDRQAGDMLARAEAHRMAAQEIARVGAKFSGPEAAKQMQVAIEDQKTKAAALQMQFHAQFIHTAVKKTVPGETAALYKGPGGWHPLGQPAGGSQGPASPVNGEVKGTPSQVSSKPVHPALGAVARMKGPEAVTRMADKNPGMFTDQDLVEASKMLVRQEAARLHPNDPGGYDKVMKAHREAVAPVAADMAKTAQTRALVAQVRSNMAIIEKTERYDGKDPEGFLSWASGAWPDSWMLEYRKITAASPEGKNSAQASAIWRERKTQALRAELMGVFNDHAHDLFGGAQSDSELKKAAMAGLSTKNSFYQMQRYLDNRSMALQKELTDKRAGITHPMQRALLDVTTDQGMAVSRLPAKGTPAP